MRGSQLTRLLAAAALVAASAAHATPKAKCPTLSADWARDVEVVKALRAYTGPDGESHIEPVPLPGKQGSYYGGSVKLTQFDFGDSTRVVLVYGHPNMNIAAHPAPYREIFIVLSGSSEIHLANGEVHALSPGSMVITEDLGSKGRSGRSGPCGYVALDLQYKADKPAP